LKGSVLLRLVCFSYPQKQFGTLLAHCLAVAQMQKCFGKLKNIGLILAFLLLTLTKANADQVISGDASPRMQFPNMMSQYGLNQAREAKQNSLGRMIPGDAAATMARLPFMQFIVKNFKGQNEGEFLMGFDRKLFRNILVSATYAHRKHNHSEDTSTDVTSFDYVCTPVTVTNPTTGQHVQTQDCYLPPSVPTLGRTVFLTARGRTRSYDGLELSVDKRLFSHVLLGLSGTLQNQKIHFPANSRNFGRSYQDSTNLSYISESSLSNNYDRNLGWDWSIKANAAYHFRHNTTFGAYFEVVNGLKVPVWRGPALFENDVEVRRPVDSLDTASLKVVKYVDLKIQKDFVVRKYGKLSVSADIFNIFNMNPKQTLRENVQLFQFLESQAIVNPRVICFELRYSY
jgi:hypothetical protein